jgi:acetyl-CoA carboxylase beta subunit
VCPKCNYHFRLNAAERLELLFDDRKYQVLDNQLVSPDPLQFVDREPHTKRLASARSSTGLNDARINARGTLGGHPVQISAMEYGFFGRSMGSVVKDRNDAPPFSIPLSEICRLSSCNKKRCAGKQYPMLRSSVKMLQ